MAVWEYKVISSGKGGFATPAHLESFLNQLGKEEWEIIHFQPQPDNILAFTGVARRPTQRDWTLEDAAAAAARAEADKLRAEFEAKFREGTRTAPAEEKPESLAAETEAGDDGLRRLRDTDRDMDPDAPEENGESDEWDKLAKEDELPTLFEAIQPLMRRNQRGAGMSVGVDHLAKKWDLSEKEVLGALKECGFVIPEDEDDSPAYIDYDGDLFWVNVNRRGEYWINTKEKPRPKFRVVQGAKVERSEEEPAKAPEGDAAGERPETAAQTQDRAPVSLPEGPALLEKIRPKMRRNRGGEGSSGSVGFLSRALKCREGDLSAAFSALGLALPPESGEAPPPVEIAGRVWWLMKDQRGGIWINERKPQAEAQAAGPAESAPPRAAEGGGSAPVESPAIAPAGTPSDSVLAALRLLLKPTRTGAVAGEIGRLAVTLGKTAEELLSALVNSGLKVPGKPREKPVFVEQAGEIFWLNRNAKDQLWLNAKRSKLSANRGGEMRPNDSKQDSASSSGEGSGEFKGPKESSEAAGEPPEKRDTDGDPKPPEASPGVH